MIISAIYFKWNKCRHNLTVRNKTLKEAIEIAKSMGYTEEVWYRPSTWGNICFFQADAE